VKLVATIEARMTSTRLPGKVLLMAAGRPMLEHLVGRLRRVPSIAEIVLATTENPIDDVLEQFARRHEIRVFRASEDDVMSRVVGAAESAGANMVVEITADCPVIDPNIVEQTIQMFCHNRCEYASNIGARSYPVGMDTQVFWLETLKRSLAMTEDLLDREHVTRHIRMNPDLFLQVTLVAPPNLHWPELGLTLDEEADYRLLKNIIEYFDGSNPGFTCGDIIALLRKRPEWAAINESVRRKGTQG
jgi:spore coat polysaccharide biosynthesis protein SpsF